MNEFRVAYLALLLVSVSFVAQFVMAQADEYEYYYEEVNVTTTTVASSSTPIATTTVTLVPAVQGTTDATTQPVLVVVNTENPKEMMPLADLDNTTDDILDRNAWSNAAIDNTPVRTTDVRRTDEMLNSTRPTKYNTTIFKATSKPKTNTLPGIVLNIYTGMYGMHSRGNNRPSGNFGGHNNVWPRAQPAVQGWYDMYGMYNRRPMQSYMPRQNAPPVYRGRGPQNSYNDAGFYNSFTYQTATKPRRNNQQTRGTTLDQQASMAVFNFLLQALGQRSGTSHRSQGSQSQVQQGTRRRQ